MYYQGRYDSDLPGCYVKIDFCELVITSVNEDNLTLRFIFFLKRKEIAVVEKRKAILRRGAIVSCHDGNRTVPRVCLPRGS